MIPLAVGGIVLARSDRNRSVARSRPRHVGDAERELAAVEIGIYLELLAVVILTATFDLRVGLTVLATLAVWPLIWLPRATRRLEMKSVVDVKCTPEAAFKFVSDPNNWPRYIPRMELMQPVHSLGIGSRFGARSHRDGHPPFEAYERVIAFEPGKRFATAIVGDPESTGISEFIPTADGTRIEYTYRSVRSLASAVSGSFFGRTSLLERLRDNRAEINTRLKALLEEQPTPAV